MNLFDQDKTLKELIDVHRRYAGRRNDQEFVKEDDEITDKLVRRALRVHRIRVHLRHASLIWWWLVRLFLRYVAYPTRNKYRRFCATLRRFCATLRAIATREESAQNAAVFGDDGELGAEARNVPSLEQGDARAQSWHRHDDLRHGQQD